MPGCAHVLASTLSWNSTKITVKEFLKTNWQEQKELTAEMTAAVANARGHKKDTWVVTDLASSEIFSKTQRGAFTSQW